MPNEFDLSDGTKGLPSELIAAAYWVRQCIGRPDATIEVLDPLCEVAAIALRINSVSWSEDPATED